VPDMANVPTAKGVLNSNFRCGVTCSCRGDLPGTSLAGQLTLRNPMRLSGRRGYLVCASDRDRGAPHDAAPPTPPGIRVTYLGGSIGLSFSMQPGFRVLSSSGPVRPFGRNPFLRCQSYSPLPIVRAFDSRFRLGLSVAPPFGLECLTSLADSTAYYALC